MRHCIGSARAGARAPNRQLIFARPSAAVEFGNGFGDRTNLLAIEVVGLAAYFGAGPLTSRFAPHGVAQRVARRMGHDGAHLPVEPHGRTGLATSTMMATRSCGGAIH
jgi:hypothetical protein